MECPYCFAHRLEHNVISVREAWADDQLDMIGHVIESFDCGLALDNGKILGYCLTASHELQNASEALAEAALRVSDLEMPYVQARVALRNARAEYEFATGDQSREDPWVIVSEKASDNYRESLLRSFYPVVTADGTLDHQP